MEHFVQLHAILNVGVLLSGIEVFFGEEVVFGIVDVLVELHAGQQVFAYVDEDFLFVGRRVHGFVLFDGVHEILQVYAVSCIE